MQFLNNLSRVSKAKKASQIITEEKKGSEIDPPQAFLVLNNIAKAKYHENQRAFEKIDIFHKSAVRFWNILEFISKFLV